MGAPTAFVVQDALEVMIEDSISSSLIPISAVLQIFPSKL
jgi:hypothetical protein